MRTALAARVRPIAAAVILTAACADADAPSTPRRRSGERDPDVPVTVAAVVRKPMPLQLHAIGTAEPHSTIAVRTQISGELTSINFREGDDVQAGQLLFTLDRRPLEAALREAESNLERDLALAANARAQANRYQDLTRRGIASREQLDLFTAQAEALDATVAADRAAVEHAKVQLEYSTIRSRVGGRAGALMAHVGNVVRAGDPAPLVVINQIVPIYVSFAIPERQLTEVRRYLRAGPVHVAARPPEEPGPPALGRITFIDNAVDPTTGTIRLKGTFANEDRRLWPGQFLEVTLTLTTEADAIVVPTVAVQSGPDGHHVFIVTSEGTAALRVVKVARTVGTETTIARGLSEGETVVTDGHIRLLPGAPISVRTDPTHRVAP
jgi:multidrug efflux system membrane fusion protein